MPIEIKELVIRAYIEPENSKAPDNSNGASKDSNLDTIAESIEQVMELIKDKNER